MLNEHTYSNRATPATFGTIPIKLLFPKIQKKRMWATSSVLEVKLLHGETCTVQCQAENIKNQVFVQPCLNDSETGNGMTYHLEHFETTSGPYVKRLTPNDILTMKIKPIKRMKRAKKAERLTLVRRLKTMLSTSEDLLNSGSADSSSDVGSDEEVWTQPKRNISHLPESVLIQIFSYFSRKERCTLCQVCRLWNNTLLNPIFWKELTFEGDRVQFFDITRLLRISPKLQTLRLRSVRNVPLILREMCRFNTGITELSVRDCRLDSGHCFGVMTIVVAKCMSLNSLDLRGSTIRSKRFFIELGLLRNLKSLNLSSNNHLSIQDLMTVSVNCLNLREFQLLNRPVIKVKSNKLTDQNLVFVMRNFQKLTTLMFDMQDLGPPTFTAILNCIHLECLCLTNCLLLTGDVFRKFKQLEKLKKLIVTRGSDLKPDDFTSLFTQGSFPFLEELDISGCWRVGGEGLLAITTSLRELKSLSIKSCQSVAEDHLPYFDGLEKLTKLNIAYTSVRPAQLPLLKEYARTLKVLTIDKAMFYSGHIHKLKSCLSSVQIMICQSQFSNDEKSVTDFQDTPLHRQ